MFKKSQRFSFQAGIPRQKIVSPLFIVRFQKTDTPVYAVIAGKTVSKKAVHRNKAKRIVREALINTLKTTPNSFTMVLFLRRPFVEYQKSVIIQELQNLVAKINS